MKMINKHDKNNFDKIFLNLTKFKLMDQLYTLITGSSSGIGRALAFECARRKMNLALVSRPSTRLSSTAEAISSEFDVDVKYFGVDLAEKGAAEKVYNWCTENGIRVNFLINNAALTGTMKFEDYDSAFIENTVNLNMLVLALLTRYFFPVMKENPGAKILNVSSMAAFFPIPYKVIYAASKAFVLSFSKGLAAELEGTGIKERINKHKLPKKLVRMSCERFAYLTLEKVEKGKELYTPLLVNRLFHLFEKLMPEKIFLRIIKKEFSKEIEPG
jgi:short-subunit dehydrogenase